MTRDERLKAIENTNLEAALVILSDPEHYGGASAMAVVWATAFLAAKNRLPIGELTNGK